MISDCQLWLAPSLLRWHAPGHKMFRNPICTASLWRMEAWISTHPAVRNLGKQGACPGLLWLFRRLSGGGRQGRGCGGWGALHTLLGELRLPQNQEERLTANNFVFGLSSVLGPGTPEASLGKRKTKYTMQNVKNTQAFRYSHSRKNKRPITPQ